MPDSVPHGDPEAADQEGAMSLHVAVISGSRADFGPLRPLLRGLHDDPRFRLSTVLCAVSSPDEPARQRAAFEDVGIAVTATVTAADLSREGAATSMASQAARALEGVSEALTDIMPDLVVLLGDRFEILAAAMAAHLVRVPIVHLSGGDQTLGSLDDAMRHAISRLASLHLASNVESAGRLRSLGVPAARIHTVGSTALDDLVTFAPQTREELGRSIDLDLSGQLIAVAYHPATQADEPPAPSMRVLLGAVREVAPSAAIVVTGSNADEGGRSIDAVAAAVAAADPRLVLVPSLGTERYWSLLHHADALVGNSSSALIEAPVVGVPVVDVGQRQASRLRAASCRHADAKHDAIVAALRAALASGRAPESSPYGDGHAVPRVLDVLAAVDDPRTLLEPVPLGPSPGGPR
jgi:UDP-hydrolysing UDP-N-acetyl-D-glucosamine 2-epimerase